MLLTSKKGQVMDSIILDTQILVQLEAVQTITSLPVEVDAIDDDDFGTLYRVWQGLKLLGTFYKANWDGLWIIQPCSSNIRIRCLNPEQAQLLIITATELPLIDGR